MYVKINRANIRAIHFRLSLSLPHIIGIGPINSIPPPLPLPLESMIIPMNTSIKPATISIKPMSELDMPMVIPIIIIWFLEG